LAHQPHQDFFSPAATVGYISTIYNLMGCKNMGSWMIQVD